MNAFTQKTIKDSSRRVNPTGFWEDKEIVYKINHEIYAKLDVLARGFALIDKERLAGMAMQSVGDLAMEVLEKRFESTQIWGFKDPKTARLIPFWQPVFSRLGINENYVIVLRNPLSSAHSHQRLSSAWGSIETGLLRWLVDLVSAIQETSGKRRMIVSYEALMENPRGQMERMREFIDIPTAGSADDADHYINDFLDRDLQRNDFQLDDLRNHPFVQAFPLCLGVYELLYRISKDELKFSDTEFVTSWEDIMIQMESNYPLICYMDSMLKALHESHNQLKSIKRSNVWKIISPLRKANDGIRALKRYLKRRGSETVRNDSYTKGK